MVKPKQRERAGAERVLRRALLIDDEAATLLPILAQGLQDHGFDVAGEAEPDRALSAVAESKPDIVLLDLHFPGDGIPTTGARLMTQLRKTFERTPIVVFTTRLDDVDIPSEGFQYSPDGYFAKPKFGTDRGWSPVLARAMLDAIQTVAFAHDASEHDLGLYIGHTKEMRDVAARIRIAAGNSLPVTIFGGAGAGKRTTAAAIHRLSQRQGSFQTCRGWTAVVRSEGGFPGRSGQTGSASGMLLSALLERAKGGTLFLDDVQKLPEEAQGELLAHVEHALSRTPGVRGEGSHDVRLIAATNHALADLAADGLLRHDLAYRLQVLTIFLPPLRMRMADLPALFELFVGRANQATGRHVLPTLRPEVRAKLERHAWPGNIGELEAAVLSAVARTTSNVLLPGDFDLAMATAPEERASPAPSPTQKEHVEPTVQSLAAELEALPVDKRYEFIKGLGKTYRKPVMEEFICHLRLKLGRRIGHKDLAAHLVPLTRGNLYDTIRQFIVTSCDVKLTKLDCNQ